MVFYWGQNSYGTANRGDHANFEKRLSYYCQAGHASTIVISFMHVYGQGTIGTNFGNHCNTSKMFPGTSILDCPEIREDIAFCQKRGVKIELGLGGADGQYGFTSESQAISFAEDLYKIAFAGKGNVRPFGAGSLDGVNLDIENGRHLGYTQFVKRLRELQGSRGLIVSAAPQCVYPDASLNDVLTNGEIDAVYVQFYNNPCGVQKFGTSDFNFNVWDKWAKGAKHSGAKVYLGVPASPTAAGSGYVSPSRLNTIVTSLARNYPSTFGGIMVWDASQAYMNRDGGKQYIESAVDTLRAAC
ncbi:glycoside hydrolase [Thamnocephalis sphaerospora]|uniref:chitinase n=1 Tax=Thamnocephalis sphaerospora TaxID=78915 RepID=A0A4P9XIZ6_9FUNG|nr:glycoside hydrolase [Thamnocephalis sphaerospora]|eukprot:RKP05705.1 glycoside hydrolase [Thamnocephalis sphaerospora]